MESIFTHEDWGWLPSAFIYFINIIFMLFVGKLIFQWMHRKIDVQKELVHEDNFAFALSNSGYYIGLLIAISAAVIGDSHGIGWDSLNIIAYGLLAVLLLNIASLINDKLILYQFPIHKEIIKDHNAGTGIIEAANFIACGLILHGAIYGESANFFGEKPYSWLLSGIASVLIFWIIGQILLVILTRVYAKVLPYNVHEEIEKDNVAVGISFAGVLIAIAILVGYGIGGDFEGWTDHLIKIGVDVGIGILLLPLMRWLVDMVLLPGQKLTTEIIHQEQPNKGAALVEALGYIGGAFLITICI